LTIDKACFCRRVKSFGRFEQLPEGHAFLSTPDRPGEEVKLYVELRNFGSEYTDGLYATKLSSSIEIIDHKGRQAWICRSFPEEKAPILSRSPLHDYCNTYSFYPTLPAGTYTLVIQITDQTRPQQPRTVRKELEFHVKTMSVSARLP
jgi:hypothetical protein